MIAVDTNVLVYAHRDDAAQHAQALAVLTRLSEGSVPWAIAWPCVYEFLRVVTHPRVFSPPFTSADALENLEAILDAPSLILLGEGPSHRSHLRQAVTASGATGNLAHDAHIAALLSEHGVRELWSFDRDFSRFPGIKMKIPGH